VSERYETIPMFGDSPQEPQSAQRTLWVVDAAVLPADVVAINWQVVNQWPRFQQRDREVLELLVRGASGPEISTLLKRSYDSIKRTMSHLLDVSGCDSTREMVALALSSTGRTNVRTDVRAVAND
jgi:DNA-binding CsgD family transcriptional regulator